MIVAEISRASLLNPLKLAIQIFKIEGWKLILYYGESSSAIRQICDRFTGLQITSQSYFLLVRIAGSVNISVLSGHWDLDIKYSLLLERLITKLLQPGSVFMPALFITLYLEKLPVSSLGISLYRRAISEFHAGAMIGLTIITLIVSILCHSGNTQLSFNGSHLTGLFIYLAPFLYLAFQRFMKKYTSGAMSFKDSLAAWELSPPF